METNSEILIDFFDFFLKTRPTTLLITSTFSDASSTDMSSNPTTTQIKLSTSSIDTETTITTLLTAELDLTIERETSESMTSL